MKARYLILLILTLHVSALQLLYSQKRQLKEEEYRCLDSIEFYKFKNPLKAIKFATILVDENSGTYNLELKSYVLNKMAFCYKNLGEYNKSIELALKALNLSSSIQDSCGITRGYFNLSTVYEILGNKDSVAKYSNLTISSACSYQITEKVTSYNQLANIYHDLENKILQEQMLLKGYSVGKGTSNEIFILIPLLEFYRNNEQDKYKKYLIRLLELDYLKKMGAENFLLHYGSFFYFENSNDIEKEKKLKECYESLKDSASIVFEIDLVLLLANQMTINKKYAEAKKLLLQYEPRKDEFDDTKDKMIYESLQRISLGLGDKKDALTNFKKASQLQSSIIDSENQKNIDELNFKYGALRKDKEILDQESKINESIRKMNSIILSILIILVIAAMSYFYLKQHNKFQIDKNNKDKDIYKNVLESEKQSNRLAVLNSSIESGENEKQRIARDLHDSLAGVLNSVSSQWSVVANNQSIKNELFIKQVREGLQETLADLRNLTYELLPINLSRDSLEAACKNLCAKIFKNKEIVYQLEFNDDLSLLNQDKKLGIYRIINDLLNNVAEHSQASNVLLQVNKFDDEYNILVEDDGIGFVVSPDLSASGKGLSKVLERLEAFQGSIDIDSRPGEGCSITINIPC